MRGLGLWIFVAQDLSPIKESEMSEEKVVSVDVSVEDIVAFIERTMSSGIGDLEVVALPERDYARVTLRNSEWMMEYDIWPPVDEGDKLFVTTSVVHTSYNYYEPDDVEDREVDSVEELLDLVGVLTGYFYQTLVDAKVYRDPEE
jgi:hypothetical protein